MMPTVSSAARPSVCLRCLLAVPRVTILTERAWAPYVGGRRRRQQNYNSDGERLALDVLMDGEGEAGRGLSDLGLR